MSAVHHVLVDLGGLGEALDLERDRLSDHHVVGPALCGQCLDVAVHGEVSGHRLVEWSRRRRIDEQDERAFVARVLVDVRGKLDECRDGKAPPDHRGSDEDDPDAEGDDRRPSSTTLGCRRWWRGGWS